MWFLFTDIPASAAVEVNLIIQLHFSPIIVLNPFILLPFTCSQGNLFSIFAQPPITKASYFRWGIRGCVRSRWREAVPTAFLLHQVWIKRRRVHFGMGGSRPHRCSRNCAEDEQLDVCPVLKQPLKPGWSISVSPSSPCTPSSLKDNFLCHVSLSIPPHPGPPHCQALERSRISVCFDYRGCPSDVSQAGRSPSQRWQRGSALHPHMNNNGCMNQTCWLNTNWFCIFSLLGHFHPSTQFADRPSYPFLPHVQLLQCGI